MPLQIASINSGSNGNCYYIGNGNDAVLVDAGLSCMVTERRMHSLGLSMKQVKAIFVSHEHTDHIKGLSTLANKYKLPVYITETTARQGLRLIKHLSVPFLPGIPVSIGSLRVTPFTKQHDAVDPHSFIISGDGATVGVFTDIGVACTQVIHYFKQCHAAFLEANYDDALLEKGGYPIHLKNRIRSEHGHLSNAQALQLFEQHRPDFMSHLLLSHLSKDNNDPQLAKELFLSRAEGVEIVIASRYEASAVYNIHGAGEQTVVLRQGKQMKLFG
jgi:phosphoribosyl 1,2-cyclic phosphodiesterase